MLTFNLPSNSLPYLRIENWIAHQSGPDKYVRSKGIDKMHSILLFKCPTNITVVPYSVESMPPVFHVVTLENPGGTSLPMNALNSSKKGISLWDHWHWAEGIRWRR